MRAVLDADGVETGTFEIPALLVAKRLAKTAPILHHRAGCCVRNLAEDDSLAENMQRVAPCTRLIKFRAFQAFQREGSERGSDRGCPSAHPQVVKRSAAPSRLPCSGSMPRTV